MDKLHTQEAEDLHRAETVLWIEVGEDMENGFGAAVTPEEGAQYRLELGMVGNARALGIDLRQIYGANGPTSLPATNSGNR